MVFPDAIAILAEQAHPPPFRLANRQHIHRHAGGKNASILGTAPVKKVGSSRSSPALARSSLPLWSRKLVIGKHSRPDVTWRPGSDLFLSQHSTGAGQRLLHLPLDRSALSILAIWCGPQS